MKKILFIMLSVMTITASAQSIKSFDIKGDLRDDFGIGIGATFNLTEKFDFAPSFNYYFPENGHLFTIDADFHYDFPVAEDFVAYPIVGGALLNAGGNGDSTTKLGVNLGAGIRYHLLNNVSLFLEGKYQWFDHFDDTYFSLGVNIAI